MESVYEFLGILFGCWVFFAAIFLIMVVFFVSCAIRAAVNLARKIIDKSHEGSQ
jgi:uncharacterized membrane protein